ncbi:MAG: HesA/MoeB/ThiF family protein [Alcanivoracaceae bacterium]|nr:HesA/MoeB/ThiF family protein [Alcanivoracaceae bacterium]
MLTDDQLLRYSRQILLPDIDIEGQEKIAAATVLIVGAGGLGNPAALYLAGAGVKKIILCDGDQLENSNLHRQIAFRESQEGESKVSALAAQLSALNSEVEIEVAEAFADEAWLATVLPQVSMALDCTDNFATRSLINRLCWKHKVPLISGAAIRFEGQLAVFDFRDPENGCYACLYGDGDGPDTLCSESGILGPVVGIVGTMQALQAIKLICGLPVDKKLYLFDGKHMTWQSMAFRKDSMCPVCAR